MANIAKPLNTYMTVSNYCTDELQRQLHRMGKMGYRLVSTQFAPNKYGCTVMYLFFTLDEKIDCDNN